MTKQLTSIEVDRVLFDDADSIEALLYQLAGAASMCWKTVPVGVFDVDQACRFVEAALERLHELQCEGNTDESHDRFEVAFVDGYEQARE